VRQHGWMITLEGKACGRKFGAQEPEPQTLPKRVKTVFGPTFSITLIDPDQLDLWNIIAIDYGS